MKRWGSGDRFLDIIDGIRAREPDATFRSSFIVGFPGETEPVHDALLAFLEAAALDWAGFFPFSEEADTAAATFDGTIAPELMTERLRECDEIQAGITLRARDRLVREGAEVEVVIDAVDADGAIGRSHREAPEIDALVRLPEVHARPGSFVRARVTGADGLDLVATAIEVLA
jgi:tRNA A37 methylthiotransferase MiaB